MSIEYKRIPHGSSCYMEALALRDKVLRKPIGLKFPEYQVDMEVDDLHVVGVEVSGDQEDLIAYLLLHRLGPLEVKMRQVAVLPRRQGSGVGSGLVKASEQLAREHGFQRMVLHSRATAVPFYLALGYEVVGDEFEEVGIPHFKMVKAL